MMSTRIRARAILASVALMFAAASAARAEFDVDAYQGILASNRGLSADALLAQHPADTFLDGAGSVGLDAAAHGGLIDAHYTLTDGEKRAIARNGFVVSERLTYRSFGDALIDIYHADLPVYISADSILHAMHASYDAIVKDIEFATLLPTLTDLIAALNEQVSALDARYAHAPGMQPMLRDLDVYLTVAGALLGEDRPPTYPENAEAVAELVALIAAETPASYPLFADAPRVLDFSQFTPRGHYAGSNSSGRALSRYFQTMMWLGRTEVYLSVPEGAKPRPADADIQRQAILAVLVMEALDAADAYRLLEDIEEIVRAIAGPSDNVTPENMRALIAQTRLPSAAALLDVPTWRAFQATLLDQPYAAQRILSQILSSPAGGGQIEPASAFLLLGQRFIMDSFIMGNVVYDKIPGGARRMLPSSLDVLFALGNDAAAQLLVPELQRYGYAGNLASLRYLVDDYQAETWDDSLYAGWLNSIRALNPPIDRSQLPTFMQTAAWWQKTMTTQLASWAELRHDHLLYAKQSYTGGFECEFPESFVEPVPEFYEAVARFAGNASRAFAVAPVGQGGRAERAAAYFDHLAETTTRLAGIAQTQLDGAALSEDERLFLETMLQDPPGYCGATFQGWYPQLYYEGLGDDAFRNRDLVVADVHTSPTDAGGAPVGWVMHAGTGPINLAVLVCDLGDDEPHAVVGPVSSYYERVTADFRRLTDEEWQTEHATTPTYRPEFVDLYLANAAGDTATDGVSLFTRAGPPVDVQARGKLVLPLGRLKATELHQNFPNPFNPETWIPFELGTAADVTITVYDLSGEAVRTLNLGAQPAGVYAGRDTAAFWDGRDDAGEPVGSGVYVYYMRAGEAVAARRMVLLK
ncbi:hypothetical protein CMK11_20830 [Candidatus Poribacteria bacterium]|nr:hypothetical protein [Candidatus Poribacteria bacterium]